jgi:microcystin degradation protein MlrC
MAGRRLKVAYARVNQETNALSPVPTQWVDIERTHWLEGDALAAACAKGGTEAKGFLSRAELSGFVRAAREDGAVDAVPLLSAWAVPAGPLSPECFDQVAGRLRAALEAHRDVDAVYLALHGAMGAQGRRDPDTALVQVARDVMGDKPVIVSHDLHANVTRARIEACTALTAYQTNPHRDHHSVGRKSGKIAFATARGDARPVTAYRSLPMIMGGGNTVDFSAPMRSIYWRLAAIERDPKVLSASVFPCHPWNDDPDLGWSTVVVTDGDRDLAERYADELAERCWAVRHEMPPEFHSASDAIREARASVFARKLGVVVFSDASDVVTAGAPGESTGLIRALIEEAPDLVTYSAIRDATVVDSLWDTKVGATVDVTLGAKLAPSWSDPLSVRATLERLQNVAGLERVAVLSVGRSKIVVTEGPPFAIKPGFYEDVGLSMHDADIVVAKNFFPFRLFFLRWARKTLYVRTRGMTDWDAAYGLTFREPVHPRDVVTDWRGADRRRRGIDPPLG